RRASCVEQRVAVQRQRIEARCATEHDLRTRVAADSNTMDLEAILDLHSDVGIGVGGHQVRVRVDEGNREITYDVAVDVQRAGQFGSRSVGGNGEETSVLVRALAERCREQGVTAGRE